MKSKKALTTLLLILLINKSYSQELPCQAYFNKEEGGGCVQRYKEDENGEKNNVEEDEKVEAEFVPAKEVISNLQLIK